MKTLLAATILLLTGCATNSTDLESVRNSAEMCIGQVVMHVSVFNGKQRVAYTCRWDGSMGGFYEPVTD